MSYWPVWLRDREVEDAEIGTLFMSRQIMSVASTLMIGWLAHRIGGTRGLILALASAAILLVIGYQFSHGFLAILLVSLVWGAVWAPTMALYDGVLVTETKARGFNYGSLRVWSSVAFILGVVICGAAVDRNGPAWVLYVGFVGIVLLVPSALLLPPTETHQRDAAKHAPFGIRDLLTSHPFVLFMVATGLCQASHAVLYSFGTLTWRAAGIDDVTISLLWGLSVAVEIVLMLFSGRLLARPCPRHDRPGARLRHGALAGHGLHDRAVGVGAAPGTACRQLRRTPSNQVAGSSAHCRRRARRWARASITRSAQAQPRR